MYLSAHPCICLCSLVTDRYQCGCSLLHVTKAKLNRVGIVAFELPREIIFVVDAWCLGLVAATQGPEVINRIITVCGVFLCAQTITN